jgi:anti-sigma B factor antagonist
MIESNSNPGIVVQNIRRDGGVTVLELAGDIDLHRSVELRENLLEVMGEKPETVIINLNQVGFMDSSGLATLVEAMQLSRRYGGALKLVGVQPRVRSILEISRLDRIFPMFENESEALAS